MKRVGWAFLIVAASALPAQAATFTIDSTNCNSTGGCYGLTWELTINDLLAPVFYNGQFWDYEAILKVTDDVGGPSSFVISAVDFKVSSTVDDAVLYAYPTPISSGWTTGVNVLNSGGCTGANSGFVCSQTATDPANFTVSSSTSLTWAWYFNTSDSFFYNDPNALTYAHIGAKLTDLNSNGKLLSATYVPEPGSLSLLGLGLGFIAVTSRRRRNNA